MLIIFQVLKALEYLHSINICHLDLKLENIIIDPFTMHIKIVNFEHSKKFKSTKFDNEIRTSYWVAPEVINGSYNKECDIWSVGVITYCLITGQTPFIANNIDDLSHEIWKTKRFIVPKLDFSVSKEFEDFIGGLMTQDVQVRLSTLEALKHPFLDHSFQLPSERYSDK